MRFATRTDGPPANPHLPTSFTARRGALAADHLRTATSSNIQARHLLADNADLRSILRREAKLRACRPEWGPREYRTSAVLSAEQRDDHDHRRVEALQAAIGVRNAGPRITMSPYGESGGKQTQLSTPASPRKKRWTGNSPPPPPPTLQAQLHLSFARNLSARGPGRPRALAAPTRRRCWLAATTDPRLQWSALCSRSGGWTRVWTGKRLSADRGGAERGPGRGRVRTRKWQSADREAAERLSADRQWLSG